MTDYLELNVETIGTTFRYQGGRQLAGKVLDGDFRSRLLAAKVTQLTQQLAQQKAVLAALEGGQNVAYSATITGVSTSFASEEAQAAAVARMQAQITTTSTLLDQYQNDLNRCQQGK